jgi:hypothetical protein
MKKVMVLMLALGLAVPANAVVIQPAKSNTRVNCIKKKHEPSIPVAIAALVTFGVLCAGVGFIVCREDIICKESKERMKGFNQGVASTRIFRPKPEPEELESVFMEGRDFERGKLGLPKLVDDPNIKVIPVQKAESMMAAEREKGYKEGMRVAYGMRRTAPGTLPRVSNFIEPEEE